MYYIIQSELINYGMNDEMKFMSVLLTLTVSIVSHNNICHIDTVLFL